MNNINTSNNLQYQQLRQQIAQQDIYRAFTLNAGSLKPEAPKGYLLKSRNPLSSIVISAADTGKDVAQLGKALVKGQSNDNQLGRFNDLGMKLGGLGIAAYLCTKRGTGTKGLMEFVGPVAFFSSMAMWPKLLIGAPMEHRFGFDIRQKYVDSQGRKKLFFQDNQYQPWDMWSDKQLDKVAEKMGIPKNVKDRHELTKEKMRSIALQGNTLWMLSAGFSPLLTSMMCNVAEKGVTKSIVNHQYNQVAKNIENLEELAIKKAKDASFDSVGNKNMQTLIARYSNMEPDDAFFKQAAEIVDPFRLIRTSKDIDNANLISELGNRTPEIKQNLSEAYKTVKKNQLLDLDSVLEKIEDGVAASPMGRKRKGGTNVSVPNKAIAAIREYFGDLEKLDPSKRKITLTQLEEAIDSLDSSVFSSDLAKKMKTNAQNFAKTNPADSQSLKQFYDSVQGLYSGQSRSISARLDEFAQNINNSIGQKFESVYTSIHLDSTKAFMRELNPSGKDLKEARLSADVAQKFLETKFASLAENDGSYAEFVRNLSTKQARFEAKTFDNIVDKAKVFADSSLEKVFGDSLDDVNSASLRSVVQGSESGRVPLYKRVLNLFIEEKTAGIKSTNHRYMMAADLEKRIQSGELKQQWLAIGGAQDAFERISDLCREIAYKSTMNDLSNKFYGTANGDEAAKIIRLMFGNDDKVAMGKSTIENCDVALKKSLETTRRNIYKMYGQIIDLAREGHKVADGICAVQKTQYSMVGKSVSELAMETFSQKFNDSHWMKMFGGLSLAVLGVTLVTQLFFGKLKNEKLYKKEEQQNQGGANAVK